jgi:hypothetical protein
MQRKDHEDLLRDRLGVTHFGMLDVDRMAFGEQLFLARRSRVWGGRAVPSRLKKSKELTVQKEQIFSGQCNPGDFLKAAQEVVDLITGVRTCVVCTLTCL